eukprot:4235875-Pleurochrysis_carterae.AAC.1
MPLLSLALPDTLSSLVTYRSVLSTFSLFLDASRCSDARERSSLTSSAPFPSRPRWSQASLGDGKACVYMRTSLGLISASSQLKTSGAAYSEHARTPKSVERTIEM